MCRQSEGDVLGEDGWVVVLVSLLMGENCAGESSRGAGANEGAKLGDSGVDAGEGEGMHGREQG